MYFPALRVERCIYQAARWQSHCNLSVDSAPAYWHAIGEVLRGKSIVPATISTDRHVWQQGESTTHTALNSLSTMRWIHRGHKIPPLNTGIYTLRFLLP